MSFTLLNLIFWPLLALAAVPLIIHLFARTKPPVYQFSSVEFLMKVIRSTVRIKRPRDILLLILRTLIILSIILVFLRPLLFMNRKLAGLNEQRNVVVVLDASASMGYMEGSQTRFAQACAQASEILSGLTSRDSADIIWLRAHPTAVFPEPGVNIGFLQQELQKAGVSSESSDIPAAMRIASDLLARRQGRKEICIISDFQKSVWSDVKLDLARDIDVIGIRVGKNEAPNLAITAITVTPPAPLVNEEMQIFCQVENFSSRASQTAVFLSAGENRQRKPVSVPAWGSATAVFTCRSASAGTFTIKTTLDEDPFPADNVRRAAIDVQESLRVGVLNNGDGTADYWKKAISALGWAKFENVSAVNPADNSGLDILLLDGWKGDGADKAMDFLMNGGMIVWKPADQTPSSSIATMLSTGNKPAENLIGGVSWEVTPSAPHSLKICDQKDGVFSLFAGAEHGDPARGIIKGRLSIPPALAKDAKLLLAYDDGIPALARIRNHGKGTLLLWNISLNPEFSDWARRPEFVPFLAELLLEGRAFQKKTSYPDYTPGDVISLDPHRILPAGDISLENENRKALRIQQANPETVTRLVSSPVAEPGLYRWLNKEELLGCSVVNFPATESDMRALDSKQVEQIGIAIADAGESVKSLRTGIELWPILLGLGLLLIIVEAVASVWAEKK